MSEVHEGGNATSAPAAVQALQSSCICCSSGACPSQLLAPPKGPTHVLPSLCSTNPICFTNG